MTEDVGEEILTVSEPSDSINVDMFKAHGPFEADISRDKTVDEISEPIVTLTIDVLTTLTAPSIGVGSDTVDGESTVGVTQRENLIQAEVATNTNPPELMVNPIVGGLVDDTHPQDEMVSEKCIYATSLYIICAIRL